WLRLLEVHPSEPYRTDLEILEGKDRIERFAPQAHRRRLDDPAQEIDRLISTDVLIEGQNLQDAGVLINYDLH
ncbi:MAG: hypothetical protein NZ742_10605, partial [Acidobacteria bacterium]|nr:hypothetical protein [Acidobacteriota bacterium]MDW7985511.1 hypothetical protein [Acidobacteriota bacterium]